MDVVDRVACGSDLCGRGDRLGFVGLGRGRHAFENREFLVFGWIADGHLEQEAIELRFGELIGSFLVDRVLGGEHEKWLGQRVGFVAEGDLAFLHGFEQGGLHFGRSAVDFIREDEVVEDRAELWFELRDLRVIDHRADEVGGEEVGRELEAREGGRERTGECFHCEGFGQTGNTFEQDVAVAKEADQEAVDKLALADEDLCHFIADRLDPRAGFLNLLL